MYVVNEYLGPLLGAIVEDNRPRFSKKSDAVKELRRIVKVCKEEYHARYRYGTLKVVGNPYKEAVRLEFGCNLWTILYIGKA